MPDAAKIIIPHAMKLDEITTNRSRVAVVELLVFLHCLLSMTKCSTHLKVCKNLREKLVLLCLDHLSLDRHSNFYRKLIYFTTIFADSREQKLDFQRALSMVIDMPGPLCISFRVLQCDCAVRNPFLCDSKERLELKKFKLINV